MAWGLEESVGNHEYEVRLGQWESCGNGGWAGSERSEVSKKIILEEPWLFCFSSYLWSWGVDTLVEGRGTKYKWKEE